MLAVGDDLMDDVERFELIGLEHVIRESEPLESELVGQLI